MASLAQELETIDLGDQRLNRRARRLLDRLGSKPTASIPVACGGWPEIKAAYRLLDNDKVNGQKILEPHYACTEERIRQHPVALCIQDTTEIDLTGKNDVKGVGPLNYDKRKGFYVHPTVVVTPERLCLGVMDAWNYAREPGSFGKIDTRNLPITAKESVRWLEGYQRVCELQDRTPGTQVVYIADREADIYEIFYELETLKDQHVAFASWLIRASVDRKTLEGGKLWETVEQENPLGQTVFDLPATKDRKKRQVTQTLRVARIALNPPYRKGKKLSPVEVTAILAREEDPPEGEKPIEWLLLTSLLVKDLDQAAEKLQWYLCRWMIEIFFRILKSGCKIEELQLEKFERIEVALSFYLIIAWRILSLTTLGRSCPEIPCDVFFDDEEWHAAYIVAKHEPPPATAPPLSVMVQIIAGFGGFIGRKGDGFPGPQTLWIGLQRNRDFVVALDAQKKMGQTYG